MLRASAPDAIAYAFYSIGYRPRESLILLGLAGPRRRIGLVTRVDLPSVAELPAVVRDQTRLLARSGADELLILVVSDVVPGVDAGRIPLPHRELVRELRRLLRRHRWVVHDTLAVGETTWRSYLCTDLTCCPARGHDLAPVLNGPVAAALIVQGQRLAPDEASVVADVEPLPAPSGGSSPDVPGGEPPDGLSSDSDEGDGPGAQAGGFLTRWRELLARAGFGDLEPAEVNWLATALRDRWLRDAVLVTLVPESGTAAEEILAGADSASMDGLFDRYPDPDLLERGRRLLSAVARTAPAGDRADALALLAWMSWWSGDGVRGRLLSAKALKDRPGHRLAHLVTLLLVTGVPPGWVTVKDGT